MVKVKPKDKVLKRPTQSQKMQGKKNRLGKTMSEEARLERRREMIEEKTLPNAIQVMHLESGRVFCSISEASRVLGVPIANIRRSLKLGGKESQIGGFKLRSGDTFRKFEVKE